MIVRSVIGMLLILFSLSVFAGTPKQSPAIKGFHEWKSEKVQAALSQINSIRTQILKAQAENNKRTADGLEKQLDQLKWNLDVATELSVTDYFVLYLSQQAQLDRFTQAAGKLATKEVAELMEAYANTLSIGPTEAVVRANPLTIPSKIPVQALQVRDGGK